MGAAASIPNEYENLSNEMKDELKKEYEDLMIGEAKEEDVIKVLIAKHSTANTAAEVTPSDDTTTAYNEGWMGHANMIQSAILAIYEAFHGTCYSTPNVTLTGMDGIVVASCHTPIPINDLSTLISLIGTKTETSVSIRNEKWLETSVSIRNEKWLVLNDYFDHILCLKKGASSICIWKLNTICIIIELDARIKLETGVSIVLRYAKYLSSSGY